MAASPLLNIIGHDRTLSMPLLQRINNQNLELIQRLKEEVKSAGTTDTWFAVGVGASLLISCSFLLIMKISDNRPNKAASHDGGYFTTPSPHNTYNLNII